MCGRFSITTPPEAMRSLFGYVDEPAFPPRYNIAPSQPVPIVIREQDGQGGSRRRFLLVRWGLLAPRCGAVCTWWWQFGAF